MLVEWARQRGRCLVANWQQLKAGIQVASLSFSAHKQAKVREGGRQDRGGFHAFRLGSRGYCLSDQTDLLGAPLWRLLSKKCSTPGGLGQEFPGEAPGDPRTRLLDRGCEKVLRTERCVFWKVEGQGGKLTCTEHSDCAKHCSYMCIVRVSIWAVCV